MTAVLFAGALGLSVLVAALAVARHRLSVVTVTGSSMEPTFREGDRLLVRRRIRRPRRGEVVVFTTPSAYREALGVRLLAKRITAVPGDPVPADQSAEADPARSPALVPERRFLVLGDNPAGFDSRHFGFVPANAIVGVVVRRLSGRLREPS
jgi:signal peptidase I